MTFCNTEYINFIKGAVSLSTNLYKFSAHENHHVVSPLILKFLKELHSINIFLMCVIRLKV